MTDDAARRALERNLRILPWWWATRWIWLGEAIWVIYLTTDRGLTLGEVLLFQAVYSAVVIAGEVPTGMMADRWGRRLSPKALQAIGASKKRRKAPCHGTYHYVFQDLSPEALQQALGVLVAVEGGLGHVAIDGKRLRGSQHETSPGVHMLHAFSTKLRAAVGALKVPPDSGECIEALELIKSLPLEGVLVTGDAAFTTEAVARAIRERGGHYFLFVKDNQPELVSELERAFGDLPPCPDHRRGAEPHRRQAA